MYCQSGILAGLDDGTLTIDGTSDGNQIFVGQTAGQISIQASASQTTFFRQSLPILIDGGNGVPQNTVNAGDVSDIVVNGGGGFDQILLNQGDQPIQGEAVINEPPPTTNFYPGIGGQDTSFVAGIRGGTTTYNNCAFIADVPAPNGAALSDICQSSFGNCFILGSLAAVALSGQVPLTSSTHIQYLGDDGKVADAFTFDVDLYNSSGQQTSVPVTFNGLVTSQDPKPYVTFGVAGSPSPAASYQFWTILYRRAYVNMTGQSDNGGNAGLVLTALTGRATSPAVTDIDDDLFTNMQTVLKAGGSVVAGTYSSKAMTLPNLVGGPKGGHAYTVVGVSELNGQPDLVTLRNPWGFVTAPDDKTNGMLTISWQAFQTNFVGVFLNPAEPPKITTPKVTTFTIGGNDQFALAASGYPAPTFSENSTDVLPAGVKFNPTTGALIGTPDVGTAGTYTLHFTADNSIGSDATQTFTLTVSPLTLTLNPPAPIEGQGLGKILVGTFTDADAGDKPSRYTAQVQWGDGQSSGSGAGNVTIVPDPVQAGVFDILATKPAAYADAANGLTFAVTVNYPGVPSDSASATLNVADAPLTLTLVVPAAVEGQPVKQVLVGTFTDADPGGHASEYSASVAWGDGTTSTSKAGTVVIKPDPKGKGVFDVIASKPNPYADEAKGLTFTVAVLDQGGATASASGSISVAAGSTANPNILTVTPSVAAITNAQVASNGFSIAVTYNSAMNTAVNPTIAFSPDVSSTLTLASDGWDSTHTVYTAVYNVADAGVSASGVQVTISGGQNSAGNVQVPFIQTSLFGVSTTISNTPDISVTANDTSAGITNGYFGESFVPTVSGPLTQLNVLNITTMYSTQSQGFINSTSATIEIFQGGINTSNPNSPSYDTPVGPLLYSQSFTFTVGNNSIVFTTPPQLVAGQTYLWEVVAGGGVAWIGANIANNNPYPQGDTLAGPGFGNDLDFQTFM